MARYLQNMNTLDALIERANYSIESSKAAIEKSYRLIEATKYKLASDREQHPNSASHSMLW